MHERGKRQRGLPLSRYNILLVLAINDTIATGQKSACETGERRFLKGGRAVCLNPFTLKKIQLYLQAVCPRAVGAILEYYTSGGVHCDREGVETDGPASARWQSA